MGGGGVNGCSRIPAHISGAQRILCEAEFFHNSPADQMFLDDAFGPLGRHFIVPGSLRVNDRHRPINADAQTVAFGAVAGAFAPREVELLQALLDIFPGLLALPGLSAIGSDANEKVTSQFSDAKFRGDFGGWISVSYTHL